MDDKLFIIVDIDIRKRIATCDFCGQHNQDCFNAPNGDADRDICKKCVRGFFQLIESV